MNERKLRKAALAYLSAFGIVTTLFVGELRAETPVPVKAVAAPAAGSQASPSAKQGSDAQANSDKSDATPEAGTTVQAQPTPPSPEEISAAKAAFEAGTAAYSAGDFADAEVEFRKAYEKIPSPHAEYWIASSKDKANHPARDVVAAYELFLTNPAAEHVGTDAVSAAQARVVELKATLPATVIIESTPPGAEVRIDGVLQQGATPLEVELVAGTHRVELRSAGYEVSLVELDAVAGTKVRAPIELIKQASTPTTDAAAIAAEPEPKKERSMVPAYVTLGIGAAGLITGTIFGILALDAKSQYDQNPSSEKADEVERNALIADMTFGVALTLGITGVVLLTAKDDDVPAPKKAARRAGPSPLVVAPYGGPTGGGAFARLTF